MSRCLPLLPRHSLDDIVAWYDGKAVSASQFLHDVAYLAARLPDRTHVLNLCEDRYHFLVAFGAALRASKVSLFPPNRTPATLMQLNQRYHGVYGLWDHGEHPAEIPGLAVGRAPRTAAAATIPSIPGDQVAAVIFTSGTTGQPQGHEKTWASLAQGAEAAARRLIGVHEARATILATVPAQHMFGLEASIMLPLQSGGTVHGARPFFPEDIRTAMTACSAAPVLVTTPLHLRACVESGLDFPEPRFVLSATAALSHALAQRAEKLFAAPVMEIYGCTEAGAGGIRRTVDGDVWKLVGGLNMHVDGNEAIVSGRRLANAVSLGDYLELQADGRFRLIGRKADLVNIAGKRMSLSDLNHNLLQVDGVVDGTFFVPDAPDETAKRLIALVVAPALTRQQLMTALRHQLDPAFLPRPLYLVDKLPRTTTGKLTYAELCGIANRCERAMLGRTA